MNDPNTVRRIDLVPASSIAAERVEWLMDCWLPRRSLTLLAGREGLGKSTIACDFAARATLGDLDNGERLTVIYLNTEDSRSMTVRPRLEAAGADLDRVHFVDVTITDDEGDMRGSLDLPRDFDTLEAAIAENGVGLVILDAAKSAMSEKIDGNSDEQVRRFLEPMTRIADRHDCAFLGLVHFGKRQTTDTGQLILGSLAWSQVARSVLTVARDNKSGQLLVTNTKANLAPRVLTWEGTLESAEVRTATGVTNVGRIVWVGESDRDARDFLRSTDDEEHGERGEIAAIVLDYLESRGGSAPAGDVLKVTRAAGLSDNTVKKARKRIGVSTRKAGMGQGWVWSIDAPAKVPEDAEGAHARERESSAPSGESSTPVPFPSPEPDPIDAAILDSLSPDYPLSARTLKGSIPKSLHEGLDLTARIDSLVAQGRIAHTEAGYLLAERTAS